MDLPFGKIFATLCFLYTDLKLIFQVPASLEWLEKIQSGLKEIQDGVKGTIDAEARKHLPKFCQYLIDAMRGERTWSLMLWSFALLAVCSQLMLVGWMVLSESNLSEGAIGLYYLIVLFLAAGGVLGFFYGFMNMYIEFHGAYSDRWYYWLMTFPIIWVWVPIAFLRSIGAFVEFLSELFLDLSFSHLDSASWIS